MPAIRVKKEKNMKDNWVFSVVVGSGGDKTEHSVILDKDYWEELTRSTSSGQAGGKEGPEELVRRSFKFLLEREPKESILREFNLRVINTYFPEYEKSLKSAKF